MVEGPRRGLELIAPLDGDARMAAHHRLSAVRAHLYERDGQSALAISHYRAAAAATSSIPERNYLMLKAARLSAGSS